MTTATVVGAGPNGLAGAVALARAGVRVTVLEAAGEIGGGTRSGEAIVPGLLHDHCSAIHPMAVGSSFLTEMRLDRHGLRWAWPEIDCAHPLDGGGGAAGEERIRECVGLLGHGDAGQVLGEGQVEPGRHQASGTGFMLPDRKPSRSTVT